MGDHWCLGTQDTYLEVLHWPVTQRSDEGADTACPGMATTREAHYKIGSGKSRPGPLPESIGRGVATVDLPRRSLVHRAAGGDGRGLPGDS